MANGCVLQHLWCVCIHLCCGPTFTKGETPPKQQAENVSWRARKFLCQGTHWAKGPSCCSLGQTAAELTKLFTATWRASVPASFSASPASTSTTTATATTPVRPPDSKRRRCQVYPSNNDRKTNTLSFTCKNISAKNTLKCHFLPHMHLEIHKYTCMFFLFVWPCKSNFIIILLFITSFAFHFVFVFKDVFETCLLYESEYIWVETDP